jgi:methionyl-tRNA formyltransferase
MESAPRIAFWGTPELTTAYLDALLLAGLKPVVIVTNPDRPKGRGHELTATPAKLWGLTHDVQVLTPTKRDDAFFAELESYNLDLSIVVAYGSILPERFISLPKNGTLNVHYSLLPRFRGAAPTEAAILAGDTETGCAIQIMAFALDSGPLIAESNTSINPDETTPVLRARLTEIGARLLTETLPSYLKGEAVAVPQNELIATYCGKIRKEDGLLDLTHNGEENYRKYRAYAEWPRTYFFAEKDGKEIRAIITQAHTEEHAFVIDRVLPEGKKEMSYKEFISWTSPSVRV